MIGLVGCGFCDGRFDRIDETPVCRSCSAFLVDVVAIAEAASLLVSVPMGRATAEWDQRYEALRELIHAAAMRCPRGRLQFEALIQHASKSSAASKVAAVRAARGEA